MALQDFKVLTFDVVGTLIDFEKGIVDYIHKLSPAGPDRPSEEAILETYRRSRAAAEAGWYPDDLVRVYQEMAHALHLPDRSGAGEGLRDSIKDWPAFPDSVAALKRLHRRCRLVAMTNARRWSLQQMSRTLDEPFDDAVTVDEAGCEKPDPSFFAFARGRLSVAGYRLEDILHVAQSQYHDVGVARRLGWRVCWIERRKGQRGFGGSPEPQELTTPDFHFTTLGGLADAFEAEPARPGG
jgi:putative hydrolase of the HAD superfamily